MAASPPSRSVSFRTTRGVSLLSGVLAAAFLLSGCVDPPKPVPPSPTIITGRVVYADDVDRGVPGVLVRAVNKTSSGQTDSTGWFSFSPNVNDYEFVQLTLTKVGFNDVVTTLTARSGQMNVIGSPIAFVRSTSGGGGSGGVAASIVLKSISASSIGVRHSGSSESARLVFEVRDDQGRPIDFGHRATVQFTLSQAAGGGAALAPDTASTDEIGLAAVALTSGTLAQAVQIRAQVIGTGIFSDPVPVAIHGGLPDARHFSFAAGTLNVPGLVLYGIVDPITAFVGDRYGNPVQTGTVVYFTTAGGLIQGSSTTDSHGRATVDLLTADPRPNDTPAFSDSAGIARIRVQTVDENRAPISSSALAVMFSGHTELSVSPTTFNIPMNGSQVFTVTVWDREHHNPLSKGSSISFAASTGRIGGATNVVLPDTHDRQYTSFTFRLENSVNGPAIVGPNRNRVRLVPEAGRRSAPGSIVPASSGPSTPGLDANVSATVTVSVTSPNGSATANVYGSVERPDSAQARQGTY